MLLQSEHQEAWICIPNSYRLVTWTWDQEVTTWLKVFDAGHFMFMALQGLIDFEFVSWLPFPQFNSHVFWTACHLFSAGVKVQIVDHACVFSQSLLTLASFVLPYFNACVFARTCQQSIEGMEAYFCDSCSMSLHLHLLWLSWYRVSRRLHHIVELKDFTRHLILEHKWSCSNTSFNVLLHILHIYRVLLVGLL